MFRSAKLIVAGLSLTTLVFAGPVRAADAPAGGDKPAKKEGGPRQNPGERLQKELDSLNLTDDQKKKIDPIVEKLKTDLQAIRDDNSIQGKDKMAKVREKVTAARTDIESNLTPEQKDKFEKDMAEQRGGGKKGGGDGAKKGGDKPAN